jgi:N-acetylglucosamine malate deacetylase 1
VENILIVAAHPDDEVLGCGGVIAKHINNGDKVHILILAEGITSRDKSRNQNEREDVLLKLKDSARKAHEILGSNSLKLLDLPDNRMDSLELLDIVKLVESEISFIKPDIIYTHHVGDLNIDHQITNQAVFTACRPQPNSKLKKIYTFEVPSSTEWQTPDKGQIFTPNTFINISNTLSKKIEALKAYDTEMKPWPHSRSIESVKHLAAWRGASVGFEAAEAFSLSRDLVI